MSTESEGRFTSLLALLVATAAYSQSPQDERHFVDDPRPVAQAIMEITDSYPVVITYEDPRYEYSGDIRDVTEQVRNPLNPNAAASDRRVLVPRGGLLQFTYKTSPDTGQPSDMADALAAILEANDWADFGGRFEIRQSGDVFHVIPVQVRDAEGQWVHQGSILDTPITISPRQLNGYEALELILEKVSDATGIRVASTGGRFLNTLMPYTGRIEAQNEPARDVLLRTLHAVSERFTWRLLFGPDVRYYALNLRLVAAPAEPSSVPFEMVTPREGEPTPVGIPFHSQPPD